MASLKDRGRYGWTLKSFVRFSATLRYRASVLNAARKQGLHHGLITALLISQKVFKELQSPDTHLKQL